MCNAPCTISRTGTHHVWNIWDSAELTDWVHAAFEEACRAAWRRQVQAPWTASGLGITRILSRGSLVIMHRKNRPKILQGDYVRMSSQECGRPGWIECGLRRCPLCIIIAPCHRPYVASGLWSASGAVARRGGGKRGGCGECGECGRCRGCRGCGGCGRSDVAS